MKTIVSFLACLVACALLTPLSGCGGAAAPEDTPATIEKAQEEAKQRIQQEYGATAKKKKAR